MKTLEGAEFGVVGLGTIGGGLAAQALEKGARVVGTIHRDPHEELVRAGLETVRSVAELKERLKPPRRVFLYLPAGPLVDRKLDECAEMLDRGDVVIDGGNSYWGDSIRRHDRLGAAGLRFVDLGTSGGADGARRGACFMAGGERDAVVLVEPILQGLAAEGGYVHAGPPGAGHFVKLVHNGIEFGMLQAIAEGVDLLEHHHERLPVADVLRCWRHGSVIRSWLIDLMEEAYRRHGGVGEIPAYIEDTGEVDWLIGDACRMEVAVPVIAQSVMRLFDSRDDRRVAPRAIAMMRHGFGDHPYGEDESIRKERREGRVGDLFRPPAEESRKAMGNG